MQLEVKECYKNRDGKHHQVVQHCAADPVRGLTKHSPDLVLLAQRNRNRYGNVVDQQGGDAKRQHRPHLRVKAVQFRTRDSQGISSRGPEQSTGCPRRHHVLRCIEERPKQRLPSDDELRGRRRHDDEEDGWYWSEQENCRNQGQEDKGRPPAGHPNVGRESRAFGEDTKSYEGKEA